MASSARRGVASGSGVRVRAAGGVVGGEGAGGPQIKLQLESILEINLYFENFFFLVIFDGASNMQSPTKPLVLC